MNNLTDIVTPYGRWINITSTQKPQIEWLKRHFEFHPDDLKACGARAQRPYVQIYPHYSFIVLLFPLYNQESKAIESAEIDFFISQQEFIVVHDDQLTVISELFDHIKSRPDANRHLLVNPAYFFSILLHKLLNQCLRMIDHISLDLSHIEDDIFDNQNQSTAKQLLNIRRNIVNMRRILHTHKTLLNELVKSNAEYLYLTDNKPHFDNLIEQTKQIWDVLDIAQETIFSLHQTNESLINYQTSEVMRTLTMFSVIVFPLTLIAAIFSMKLQPLPFAENPYGFWIVLAGMFGLMLIMYLFFKKKRWL